MLVKVAELIGPALDWAVAKCEGRAENGVYSEPVLRNGQLHIHYCGVVLDSPWCPTTNWAQGGPIIEREEIGTKRRAPCMKGEGWEAMGSITAKVAGYRCAIGPTPLIAALRCLCVSKLGDEVEFPDNLF